MKKMLLVTALLSPITASAATHMIEFKSERRGNHFQRHFAELHGSWGQQGVGVLNTTLELNGTTTQLGTLTNIHPGFTYLMPISEDLLIGPAAKYNYVAGKQGAIKAGVAWAYTGLEQIILGGQVRYDHQLSSSLFDLVRTDIIFGFPINPSIYLSTTSTNASPVEGAIGSWQEYEFEFKYTRFAEFQPYFGTTITTDNDPLGLGDNAYIVGFYIPFS